MFKFLPQNLQNSLKVAVRILAQHDVIGIYQLMLYAVSIFTRPLDWTIAKLIHVDAVSSNAEAGEVVFVSGYSRSGTTMIYQVLNQAWDCEYINNTVILFPRLYPYVSSLCRRVSMKRETGLRSYYGRTLGLYGANDGAQLMERWFPGAMIMKDEPIGLDNEQYIKSFFARHYGLHKKPLIVKNCNLYHKFAQLAVILPKAHFVFIKRDPRKIIESTIKARSFIQGSGESSWEFSENSGQCSGAVEEICLNLKNAYDYMGKFQSDHKERCTLLSYEEFCADPGRALNILGAEIFGREMRRKDSVDVDALLVGIRAKNEFVPDSEERREINDVVARIFEGKTVAYNA